jgi:predicted aldo/keto reductase-like oxidoreductase
MSEVSRREFLAGITAAAGVATLGGRFALGAPPAKIKKGSDLVKLGRSGIQPTVLGMGTGTVSGTQQMALGIDGFTGLIRHGLERGLRYIDTADSYGSRPVLENGSRVRHRAHEYLGRALKGVPRDKYFIQTKTGARDPRRAKADLERFLKELNTDYVDTLLMHCMTQRGWPADMRRVMDVLDEAKKKGQVRAVGFSCHGWDPLAGGVDPDWPDVQLVRINPFDDKMDGEHEKVAPLIKQAHDKGRGMIGMKIYGETGYGSRQKRLESLKYVFKLGCVDCFTIGFTSTKQLDETLELIELAQA